MRDEPKLKYMPWYWRDFGGDRDVQAMGDAQQMWYMRLLAYQFDLGYIEDNPTIWYNVIRPADAVSGDPVWETFISHHVPKLFPLDSDGNRRNPRLEKERQKQINITLGRQKGAETGKENLERVNEQRRRQRQTAQQEN